MKRLVLLLAALCFAAWPVAAQTVLQTGLITPGHAAKWITSGVVGDAGPAAGGAAGVGLTELGITNTGTPLCINDAAVTAAGGYHQLCLGALSLGGGLISYQAFGGAAPLSLSCNINGTVYACFPTGGNVTGPVSSTDSDIAVFNGISGKIIKDGGATSQFVATSTFTQGKLLTGTGPGAYHAINPPAVNILDYNSSACTGSDDSAALVAAAATGLSVQLPMGTCTFNTQASGVVVNLATTGQCIIGAGVGQTVIATTISTGAVFELSGNNSCIRNMQINAPSMTDGFLILDANASNAYVDHILLTKIAGFLAIQPNSGEITITDVRGTGIIGGTASIYDSAAGATKAFLLAYGTTGNAGPIIASSWVLGAAGSTGVVAILLDGDANSSSWRTIRLNNFDTCMYLENAIGAAGQVPNFTNAFDFQCQTPASTVGDGAGVDIKSGTQIQFHQFFLNAGGGDGISCQSTCTDLQVFGPRMAGVVNNEFVIAGTNVGIYGGNVSFANNSNTCSACANIRLKPSANHIQIVGIGTMGGSHTNYDINAESGANNVFTAADNFAAPTAILDPGAAVISYPLIAPIAYTPAFIFGTVGNSVWTCTVAFGQVWQLGLRFWFDQRLTCSINSYTTASGVFILTGIPFAALAGNPGTSSIAVGRWGNITLDAGYTQLAVETSGGSAQFSIWETGSGKPSQQLTTANVPAGTNNVQLDITGSYQ